MSDLFQAEGGVVQFKGRDQIALFQSAASPLPPISTGSRSVCESEVRATLLSQRTPWGVGLTKPGLSPDLSKSIMQQRQPALFTFSFLISLSLGPCRDSLELELGGGAASRGGGACVGAGADQMPVP